ncbi:MAG: hypothetical protein JW889_16750 [Verrucomicrobia bacterium]|nr:hypothetical protein [Verrucomicrobiota bacterium]
MSDALDGQTAEARRQIERLQVVVDLACAAIRSGTYTRAECEEFANAARQWAGKLCPERLDLFDMIYARRMQRLIDEFARDR